MWQRGTQIFNDFLNTIYTSMKVFSNYFFQNESVQE